eukprot:545141-Prorocentrum_minimum.AAC.5
MCPPCRTSRTATRGGGRTRTGSATGRRREPRRASCTRSHSAPPALVGLDPDTVELVDSLV